MGTNAKQPSITPATLFVAHIVSFAPFAPPGVATGSGCHPQSRNALFETGVPAPLSPAVRVHGFRHSWSSLRIAFKQLTERQLLSFVEPRAPGLPLLSRSRPDVTPT